MVVGVGVLVRVVLGVCGVFISLMCLMIGSVMVGIIDVVGRKFGELLGSVGCNLCRVVLIVCCLWWIMFLM